MRRKWSVPGLRDLGAAVAVMALSSHAYGALQATPSPAPDTGLDANPAHRDPRM